MFLEQLASSLHALLFDRYRVRLTFRVPDVASLVQALASAGSLRAEGRSKRTAAACAGRGWVARPDPFRPLFPTWMRQHFACRAGGGVRGRLLAPRDGARVPPRSFRSKFTGRAEGAPASRAPLINSTPRPAVAITVSTKPPAATPCWGLVPGCFRSLPARASGGRESLPAGVTPTPP